MGDHVKVIAGRYEGDTGLIVRVEENFVILFSDLTMHEVFAPAAPPPPPQCCGSVVTVRTLSPVEGAAQRPAALLRNGVGRGRRRAARVGRAGPAGSADGWRHCAAGEGDVPGNA